MMPEYSEADVNRLAEMTEGLASTPCSTVAERLRLARHLLDRGVTLPPPPLDPADVVAGELWLAMFRGDKWLPDQFESQRAWTAAVRDLFTFEALAQAAAKVQEADR